MAMYKESFMTAPQAHYKAMQCSDIIIKEETKQLICQIEKNIDLAVKEGKMKVYVDLMRDTPALRNPNMLTECIYAVKQYFQDLGYEIEAIIDIKCVEVNVGW